MADRTRHESLVAQSQTRRIATGGYPKVVFDMSSMISRNQKSTLAHRSHRHIYFQYLTCIRLQQLNRSSLHRMTSKDFRQLL